MEYNLEKDPNPHCARVYSVAVSALAEEELHFQLGLDREVYEHSDSMQWWFWGMR